MSAPGVGPAPGIQQADNSQPGRPGGFPPNFQPPANMPNINFSAPVIRLGTTGPAKPVTTMGGDMGRRDGGSDHRSGRMGLGAQDSQRRDQRQEVVQLIPPTKDEIVRTIYVGGLTEGTGSDEGVERILRSSGRLRRWQRAMDADNKPCRFGFAEYEDPDSLATAIDVLRDVEVPTRSQPTNGANRQDEGGENPKVEKSKLLVRVVSHRNSIRLMASQIFVDDSTMNYLESCHHNSGDQDPIRAQLRMDAAKSALASVLADLANPAAHAANSAIFNVLENEVGSSMRNGETDGDAEIVTIPLTVDDELSDIPAEMRETVAKEIAAFRDRSNRRDMERLKREEEMEAIDRQRNGPGSQMGRMSPTSTGPGGANSIPVGPRDKTVPNAPSGPKGYQGSQVPKDYQKGVSFVNGTGVNGAGGGWIDREDEDTDADDDELEQRRREKKESGQDKLYLDQERRWLNRERSRTAAIERERARDKEDEKKRDAEREIVAKRLKAFDDDEQAEKRADEYFHDRSQWIRDRAAFRQREINLDDMDRAAEDRERARETQQQNQARGMADDFLNRQALELDSKTEAPREPQRFKLSLGAAAQKAQSAAASKRTVAEVEGLLEDEETEDAGTKRTLIPIKFDNAADAAMMTDEERQQAVRNLAAEIPQDKDGLWSWPLKWDFLDETVITDQLKPFVEKKIVEFLGVQEQMLVEVVDTHIRKREGAQELVEQLEGVSFHLALCSATPYVYGWMLILTGTRCRRRSFGQEAVAHDDLLLGEREAWNLGMSPKTHCCWWRPSTGKRCICQNLHNICPTIG